MFVKRVLRKARKLYWLFKTWLPFYCVTPVSRVFGLDRGSAIDRYYIEKFLYNNKAFIKGHLLEIAENSYSQKFGHDVSSYEILHYNSSNLAATIIGDLTKHDTLPHNTIDCFICTQTLNVIYDLRSSVEGAYKLLTSDGVFLGTVPGISQISRYDMDRWGDYWRFTDLSIRKVFEEFFGKGNVEIELFGNVRTCMAFLNGLSLEELPKRVLDKKDNDYQMIIGIKAIKRVYEEA